MKKRIFSVLLAAVTFLSMLPAEMIEAVAATLESNSTAVKYIRYIPEVAILNAHTGASSKFYEKLKGKQTSDAEESGSSAVYPQYNGMEMLYGKNGGNWSWKAKFSSSDDSMTSKLAWGPKEIEGKSPSFAESTLKKLMQTTGNLEAKLAASFQNYEHPHKINWKSGATVNTFLKAHMEIASGSVSNYINGCTDVGVKTRRDGEDTDGDGADKYRTLKYFGDDGGGIVFERASIEYSSGKTCKCVGATANQFMLVFRDQKAPALKDVSYSFNDGDWKSRYSIAEKKLKVGDTVEIKLQFDEPIRFSDDKAANKEKLFLGLQTEGDSIDDNHKAFLYKLEEDSLYFKYTVPEAVVEEKAVLSLNMDSLFSKISTDSEIELVQLCRDGVNFKLASDLKGDDGSKKGFTISDSYITDLAGNSIENTGISSTRLKIDTVAPYIGAKAITFNASMNNADIKEAKGNPNPASIDYGDESDNHLGEGDSISLVVTASEALNLTLPQGSTQNSYLLRWEYGVAKTTIKVPDGYTLSSEQTGVAISDDNYITVKTRWFTPSTPNKWGDPTQFTFWPIKIEKGMYVEPDSEGNKGEVLVTEIDFTSYPDEITDMCGNKIEGKKLVPKEGANSNAPYIDANYPSVTDNGMTEEGDGFRYALKFEKNGGTEVANAYGHFVLNHKGDDHAYKYMYAVSSAANVNEVEDSEWKEGVMGVEQTFLQHLETYIHVKPVDEEKQKYENLDKCSLTVFVKNYAGNTTKYTTADGAITWYIDKVPPTVSAEKTERKLTSTGGTLSVGIKLSDSHGISEWQYAWSDSSTEAPTSWTDGAISGDGTEFDVTATADVSEQERFEKQLWVKAKDNSKNKNETTKCVGAYSYDLSEIKYGLSYKPTVTNSMDITVSELAGDDALVFIVKVPSTGKTYARAVRSRDITETNNIFELDYWYGYVSDVSNDNGKYTISYDRQVMMQLLKNYKPTGNIEVTVLSGKAAGLVENDGCVVGAGNESYQFSEEKFNLRVTTENPWGNYSIYTDSPSPTDYIWLTAEQDLTVGNKENIWKNTVLNSFAGITFKIFIASYHYDWKCEDIDTTKSKLVFKNRGNGKEYEFPIGNFKEAGETAATGKMTYEQYVSVAGDFETGVYDIKLKLVSVTGDECEIPCFDNEKNPVLSGFAIDATKANDKFSLTSITHGVNSLPNNKMYGINEEIYPTVEYVAQAKAGLITLPVSGGSFDMSGYSPTNVYTITFSSPDEPNRQELVGVNSLLTYAGQYRIDVWNDIYPQARVAFYPDVEADNVQTTVKNTNVYAQVGFTTSTNYERNPNFVYLKPDCENVVYFQKVYANGEKSSIQSVRIKPETNYLEGSLSIDKSTHELVFTPKEGLRAENFLDAKVYAIAYNEGQDYEKGEGEVLLLSGSNGDWRCPLVEGGAYYRAFTINANGSVWADEGDFVHQVAPSYYVDNESEAFTTENGAYQYTFRVKDDAGTMLTDGLKLNISFNEEYCNEELSFVLDESKMEEVLYENRRYIWKTGKNNGTGIYKVYFEELKNMGDDELEVTVYGVVKKQNTETQTDQSMEIKVSATDDFGYRGDLSSGVKTVKYVQPKVTGSEMSSDGLKLSFTQPVLPAESWAWNESDLNSGGVYDLEWEGSFPILENGTHTVEFYDVFGNSCTDEFTTDAFTMNGYDWGVELSFSETELTKEAVLLQANMVGENADIRDVGVIIREYGKGKILTPEGYYNGTFKPTETGPNWAGFNPNGGWLDQSAVATSTPRQVKLDKNMVLEIEVYNSNLSNGATPLYVQRVHIDNIANEAPKAELHYYIPSLGQEFVGINQLEAYIDKNVPSGEKLTVYENVQVWYRTSRKVTPTENTGSEVVFTPDSARAHTFKFKDEMENDGSVTVELPERLEIQKSPVPIIDRTPPSVNLEISMKRFGSYAAMEGMLINEDKGKTEAENELAEKLGEMALAQGFALTLNVSDESGYDISVTGESGGEIPEGVLVSGNIIAISKAATFEVRVVDRAKDENGDPIENTTAFTVKSDMFGNIDNTPPTAEITSQANGLYGRTLTVELSDKDNQGNDTTEGNTLDNITLTSPLGVTKLGNNKYSYAVTDNGEIEFVFVDSVGNRNAGSKTVSGIDTAAPTLEVTWAPPYNEVDYETGEVISVDHSKPSEKNVNTNVTAFLDSDKAMYDLSVEFTNIGKTVKLLEGGAPTAQNPFVYREGESAGASGTGAEKFKISAAPERVTVTYYDSSYYDTMKFKATAANTKTTEKIVSEFVGIDKTAPTVDVTCEDIYLNSEYAVPIAVKAIFKPDEEAISQNYGKTVNHGGYQRQEEYTEYEPLEVVFKANGTYNVNFSDEAGNVTVVPVTIENIDRTAPTITLGERQETGQSLNVSVTVDEDCKITTNEKTTDFYAGVPQTLTYTQNGTYLITATDAAGNQSVRAVVVGNIDKIVPSLTFDTNTVYVMQNDELSVLEDALNSGYNAWDDKTTSDKLKVDIDSSKVDISKAGYYEAEYSVEDEAGNKTTAKRFVQVIGEDTVCVRIDGKLILPGSTALVKKGEAHKLTLQNSTEPFTVKARLGILGAGQMKYMSASSLKFDENGEFIVNNSGYYTLLVTTQSRQMIRILMYAD